MGNLGAWAQELESAAPASDASEIIAPEPPLLSLQAVPAYGPTPLTVGFALNAVDPGDGGFVSFTWNFGDGHVSTLPAFLVSNTYTMPGTYVVTVTGVTADGRSVSAFTGVTVTRSGVH